MTNICHAQCEIKGKLIGNKISEEDRQLKVIAVDHVKKRK